MERETRGLGFRVWAWETGWDRGGETGEGIKLFLPDRSGDRVGRVGTRTRQEDAFGSKAISGVLSPGTQQEPEGTRQPPSLAPAPPGTVPRTSKAPASKARRLERSSRVDVIASRRGLQNSAGSRAPGGSCRRRSRHPGGRRAPRLSLRAAPPKARGDAASAHLQPSGLYPQCQSLLSAPPKVTTVAYLGVVGCVCGGRVGLPYCASLSCCE